MMWQVLSGLSLLSLASVSVSAKIVRYDQGTSQERPTQIPGIVPGKFIVEFEDGGSSIQTGNDLDRFYKQLKDKGISAHGGRNYTGVFEGCSFQADEKTKPEAILELPMVKRIWPVRVIQAPTPKVVSKGANANAPLWSSHAGTGVLDLHEKGYLGEGVVVAIVDTGIDYTHPALGGSVGPESKILGGVDIVGDDWTSGQPPAPDQDIQDCNGHGTHVSGIVAGEPPDGRFVSVAPKAKLRGYKVFGCGPSTDEEFIIDAFIQAYRDGVDIINASIGGPDGWTEGAWQHVANKIVKKGVFIAISAGNYGDAGSWYASSGSTAPEVLAVASVDNEETYTVGAEVRSNGEKKSIAYLDSKQRPDGWQLDRELEVYATSTNTSEIADACLPLPDNTPDLTGKLVVVRRGTCTFSEKEKNVAAKGGQYLMFYADQRPVVRAEVGNATIQYVGMVDAAAGEFIVRSFADGKKTTVYFPKQGRLGVPNTLTGGYASIFTEWGPSWEGYMKPEIAAPGGGILSTYLMSEGGYAVLSGTSMASPYIAGIAALYIGKAGGRKNLPIEAAAELKKRIITSGRALNWNDGQKTDPEKYAPIAQIGGGYVDATKVLLYTTSVSPGKLELNDTRYFKPGHYINVKNSGKNKIVCTVTHLPVDTFYTFAEGDTMPKAFPPNFADKVASVHFSKETIDVRPGTTCSFKAVFTPPSGLDEKLLPVYGGKIVINCNNDEKLEVPYLGIGGSIKAQKPWNESEGIPEISGPEGVLTGPYNFTLQGTDRPTFAYINDWGSPEIEFNVVTADWHERNFCYPPIAGQNKFVGSIVTSTDVPFPLTFQTRNHPTLPGATFTQFTWTGIITDGEKQWQIPPGKYKINMRALRVFGRPGLGSDWQSVTSPVITILDVPPQEIPSEPSIEPGPPEPTSTGEPIP